MLGTKRSQLDGISKSLKAKMFNMVTCLDFFGGFIVYFVCFVFVLLFLVLLLLLFRFNSVCLSVVVSVFFCGLSFGLAKCWERERERERERVDGDFPFLNKHTYYPLLGWYSILLQWLLRKVANKTIHDWKLAWNPPLLFRNAQK